MDKATFITKNKKNEDVECEILFTFDSDETNKSYIVYTDNSIDEKGNKKIYASIYEKKEDEIILKKIESEKEYKIIELILNEFKNSEQ